MGSASKGRCLNRRKDVWGGAIGEKRGNLFGNASLKLFQWWFSVQITMLQQHGVLQKGPVALAQVVDYLT